MSSRHERLAETNRLIELFGEEMKLANRAEKRESLKSVLFNVPLRSVVGWRVLKEAAPGTVRLLLERVTPEELGTRMRRLGCRPYGLQLFFLAAGYMLIREQERIDLGLGSLDVWEDDPVEDVELIMWTWARMSVAYRRDEVLLPGQAGGRLNILDDGLLAAVVESLRPRSEDYRKRARRMFAAAELCSFVMHGEQRDGNGGHGPYALADGRTLFFKEINDLRNDYLPWARTENRNVHDNLVIAYAVRGGVEVHCDMFGSMVVQPHDFDRDLDSMVVMAGTERGFELIDEAGFEEIEAAAAAMQEELYLKAIEWDDRYRIEYAGPLYANHLRPFLDLAGFGDEEAAALLARCERVAAGAVDDLLAKAPTIWQHMGQTEGPMMAPIAAGLTV